jgi:AraC family transcriptional regulator of adaptative response / DNA-3-methyladenine glycosylase II
LLSTDLPITDVAFAAGFGSVRQFNDTVAAVYERTPSEVRAARRTAPEHAAPGVDQAETRITLQLPARAPFDGAGVLRFLGTRALPGVETATATSYARTVRLPHGTAAVEVTLSGTEAIPALACSIRLAHLADLAPLVSRVRRLFDLDADASAIDRHLAADPALAASVTQTPGIRVPGSMDAEETLFRALIGQQISVAAARTALSRLADALGERLPGPEPRLLFPTPAQIAAGGRAVLRGPGARIATILRVAQALTSGDLALSFGQTRAELEASLVALPGIGPWTAGYMAMRVLGSPDILLTSDLALRQGAARLGLAAEQRALAARGADWAPWRSYAGMHLWLAASPVSSKQTDRGLEYPTGRPRAGPASLEE